MNDMSSVIVPKSDQINADDFITGPRTITITNVQIRGGQEQPVSIYFEGSDKAFRPCKSMSRVLVQAWGPDASKYIGRSLTLYRDPTVKWAGLEVGGIRISHMSHIDGKLQLQLTATKGQRKPHVVMPLAEAPKPAAASDRAAAWTADYTSKVTAAPDADALEAFVTEKAAKLAELETKRPELHAECVAAVAARRQDFSSFADDDFGDDTPAWSEPVADLKAKIETADAFALTDLRGRFIAKLRDGLPAEVIDEVEAAFAARGRALEREGDE